MKPKQSDLAALTLRGRDLHRELAPMLRRHYGPLMREPVPSCFLRLIDDLQYADERHRSRARAKAA